MPQHIRIDQQGPIWRVVIDRPDARNAHDLQTFQELVAAFDEVEVDPGCRCAVLTGAGDIFSAGQDLRFTAQADPQAIDAYGRWNVAARQRIQRNAKPVVAAVNGPAIGGGVYLATSCDLVVAVDTAFFQMREIQAGNHSGGAFLFTIGRARSLELSLLGGRLQAPQALRNLDTQEPEHPQFFTKPWTAIVPHEGAIRYDQRVTRRLDYEVELAVVIGQGGRDIAEGDAPGHIFGYTILNDISARDLQKRHDQWFKGKAIDGSCPLGPWIVSPEAVGDPHALRISLKVNGEQRQNASTGAMIFSIPRTIASLSSGLTLEPGDVIATGTPSGVGYAMNPRQWLKDGDVIECEIEKIGKLVNRVEEVIN